MSKIPEFKFDFDAVKGMEFTEAFTALFKQMEGHYNKHIKPAPLIIGGAEIKAPAIFAQNATEGKIEIPAAPAATVSTPQQPGQLYHMDSDNYEIKKGDDLGLKGKYVINGVTKDGAEIFDTLVDFDPAMGDQIVTGENGKYDLGRK